MGKIKWTEKASQHLQSIHEYISKDSKTYATRFIKSLAHSAAKLETMPLCGRVVPEFQHPDIREVIFRNYRVVYRIVKESGDVEILAVVHGARELDKAIKEEWVL